MKNEIVKNKKIYLNCLEYIVIVVISVIMCSNYINVHYATDTYKIINLGYENYALDIFLNAGRLISCLLLIISGFFRVDIYLLIIISTIAGILISCISVMILKNIVVKDRNYRTSQNILILRIMLYNCF